MFLDFNLTNICIYFIIYNAKKWIYMTVEVLIKGIVSTGIVPQRKRNWRCTTREERRKRGKKTRGPFLLERKRWLQLSRCLHQRSLSFLDSIPVIGITLQLLTWKFFREARYWLCVTYCFFLELSYVFFHTSFRQLLIAVYLLERYGLVKIAGIWLRAQSIDEGKVCVCIPLKL